VVISFFIQHLEYQIYHCTKSTIHQLFKFYIRLNIEKHTFGS
jgi:hypothetical protein